MRRHLLIPVSYTHLDVYKRQASALVLTWLAGIPLVPSLLATAGVWVTVVMAATITGQTGIDPMEIFGILVLLTVRTIWHIGGQEAFLVTAVVAVATGLAGDAMQDLRAGSILGTDPCAQLVSEAAGGIAGAVAAAFTVFLLREAFGTMGPGTELAAPQAFAVKSMIDGLPDRGAFLAGLAGGFVLSPVSYTHLDVYKRQPGGLGGGQRRFQEERLLPEAPRPGFLTGRIPGGPWEDRRGQGHPDAVETRFRRFGHKTGGAYRAERRDQENAGRPRRPGFTGPLRLIMM